MPDENHPTRSLLLDTGLALAETGTLAAMSVDHVVRAAGVSKGTFYVHFKDRMSYLAALHRRFYETVGERIRTATASLAPGGERLRRASEVYLDECLRARGVRAMLLEVRSEPVIASQIRENIALFGALAAEDLRALRVPEPTSAARLYVAMVHEPALAELERGRLDSKARRALWHLGQLEA